MKRWIQRNSATSERGKWFGCNNCHCLGIVDVVNFADVKEKVPPLSLKPLDVSTLEEGIPSFSTDTFSFFPSQAIFSSLCLLLLSLIFYTEEYKRISTWNFFGINKQGMLKTRDCWSLELALTDNWLIFTVFDVMTLKICCYKATNVIERNMGKWMEKSF